MGITPKQGLKKKQNIFLINVHIPGVLLMSPCKAEYF